MTEDPVSASSARAGQLAVEIRRLRRAARLSQPQLAAMVHYSRQYISMAEQPGNNIPSATLVQALDQTLHAGGALVRLRDQLHTAHQTRSSFRGVQEVQQEDGRTGQPTTNPTTGDALRIICVIAHPLEWEMWAETKRHTFLMQAAGTVTTVLNLIARSPDRVPSRALHSENLGLDTETLEGLEQTTLGLRRAYRSASALSLLGPSHGTLNLLTEMAPRSGKHLDRVVTAIGQMAALIGTMLTMDLEDFAAGRCYLSVAARAAQQAGNNELLAFTLGARAFHAAYSGDLLAGSDHADSALNIASRGISPTMHGWLSAVASEMHAMDNNELVCRRLLDDAATYLSNADPADPWTGVGVFNAEKLIAYLGGDLMRLGRYREAQGVLHDALDQLDPSLVKHRCTAYVDLAEAYAAEGKIDEAADHAINAICIVASIRHAGSLRRVEQLYEEIRMRQSSATRRLGEELVEMKAAW